MQLSYWIIALPKERSDLWESVKKSIHKTYDTKHFSW